MSARLDGSSWKELSNARTIGLIAGVTAGAIIAGAAIALATKQSCPFIYAWDGTEYVFDDPILSCGRLER